MVTRSEFVRPSVKFNQRCSTLIERKLRKDWKFNDVSRYEFIARIIAKGRRAQKRRTRREMRAKKGDRRRKNTLIRADGLCIWNQLIDHSASFASRID